MAIFCAKEGFLRHVCIVTVLTLIMLNKLTVSQSDYLIQVVDTIRNDSVDPEDWNVHHAP